MSTNFPTTLDVYPTLVDNVDDVLAAHANDRGDAIKAIEAKVGINSSVVATTIDYFLKHASGAYRTHIHDGSSDDGANIPGASLTLLSNIPAGAGVIPIANIPGTDGTSNPTNLLSNGDFEAWSAGTAVAPDGWTKTGANATIARESTIIKLGTYSAKLTRVGTDCTLEQVVSAEKGAAYWNGRKMTFGCWVYATIPNAAKLYLGANSSSYHTGNSTWQWLSVTFTGTGTAISAYLFIGVDTSAYFDGAMCVEGEELVALGGQHPIENFISIERPQQQLKQQLYRYL